MDDAGDRQRPTRRLIVHALRHTEAEHKVTKTTNIEICNPRLTQRGQEQCETIRQTFKRVLPSKPKIFSSPLYRALETIFRSFPSFIDAETGTIVRLLAELQSLDDGRNGTASSLHKLSEDWGFEVSFKELRIGYNRKDVKETAAWATIPGRRAFLNTLLEQIFEEMTEGIEEVVFGTHSSIIREVFYLDEDDDYRANRRQFLHSFEWDSDNRKLIPLSQKQVAAYRDTRE
ncbi:uncharacterized protein LY89DRAFT_668157 [Mollisia scopiformis]|uniref:Uncharacterized protein n=1 Tax=Mollisia scopiformis TaxID=149040 RepID=A0A194XCQ5_MOLSC|nr:uncharacterized protein LY89DRAFT_668157 [Mollisia scopiformis]KUJ17953.1 hypothetical protein LY89DRAFT_668157 [Mollisia scopiformis]